MVVVGVHAEDPRERPQWREHEVLHPDRRCGNPAFVAEVPEGGAELERVPRRAPWGGLAVGHQTGDSFVKLLGEKRRAQLNNALDVGLPGVPLRVRDASGHDDRLTRSGHAFLAAQGEVGFARHDGEALLLAGVDVLGDDAAGDVAPLEADELARRCPRRSRCTRSIRRWRGRRRAGSWSRGCQPDTSSCCLRALPGWPCLAGGPDAREVVEARGGGAQQQDAGGDARGHGEGRA